MSRIFPRAEDLNQEEIDFELQIRNQPEDVFRLDLAGKQRLLRNLFKNDQKDGLSYKSPYNIGDEIAHIEGRIVNLEKALEKNVEPKYESRVLHYWYRAKWSRAKGEDEKKIRRELVQKIEKLMIDFQFGPPQSPIISQINTIIQGGTDLASGGHVQAAIRSPLQTENELSQGFRKTPPPSEVRQALTQPSELQKGAQDNHKGSIPWTGASKGAIPKVPPTKLFQGKYTQPEISSVPVTHQNSAERAPEITVPREEWEEMRKMMSDIMRRLSQGGNQRQGDSPSSMEIEYRNRDQQQRNVTAARMRTNGNHSIDDEDSEDEARMPRSSQVAGNRQAQMVRRDSDYGYGGGWSNQTDYETWRHPGVMQRNRYDRRQAGQGRVEKWKMRFSGEPRSTMSVENFLYKAKKLAQREEVSKQTLLRDVHMLLEGAASDWFFTFVDDFDTWEDFETSISYRFGNPNKDQGIRTKIQERKQQRGEPFIAFVTEIEKMNRLLSKPLSTRRKFEVIWDNMRQHYRSKISIVEVKDLQQLTKLNYRIDAADPQLQMHGGEGPPGFQRRPINQVDAEGSEYDNDQSVPINAVNSRPNQNFSQGGRQTGNQRATQGAHPTNPISCWNCQGQGHGWRQCTRPKVIFCYGCGNLGRTIRSCERCSRTNLPRENQQGNE